MGQFTDLLLDDAAPQRPKVPQTPLPGQNGPLVPLGPAAGTPALAPAQQPQAGPEATPQIPGGATSFMDLLLGDEPALQPPPFKLQSEKTFLDKVGDLLTGEGRRDEDLPELARVRFKGVDEATNKAAEEASQAIALSLNTNVDPQAVADVAVKFVPGARSRRDSFDNVIIRLPDGQEVFVNAPGLSTTDFTQFLAQALQFIPAVKVGAFFKNLAIRAGVTAATTAATSVAQDIAGEALGSEQGIDPIRAAVTGAGGGIAELVAPFIGRLGESGLRLLRGKGVRTPAGDPTPAMIAALRAFDIEPGAVTQEMLTEVERAVSRVGGRFGDDATRATSGAIGPTARTAQNREFGIPLTRGEATQNTRQIAREEAMRNFARGGGAGRTMEKFDIRRRGQIEQAASRTQGGLSGAGAATIEDPVAAAGAIIDGLRARGADLDAAVDAAYDVVSELGASFDPAIVKAVLPRMIRGRLRDTDTLIFKETPAAMEALKTVDNLANAGGLPGVKAIKFRAIEGTRRRLNALIGAARNPSDRRAVTLIKKSFDDWTDDAFENALLDGDPELLSAIKLARGTRATKGKLLEPRPADKDAGLVIERILQTDVTNVEAANWLFGNAKLGQTGRSVRLAKRAKAIFGPDSREWQILREGAFMRGIYGAKGTGGRIGAQQLKSNLDEMLSPNSRQFLVELFEQEEIALFNRLRNAIRNTLAPPTATNPSRSGFEVGRLIDDLFGKFLIVGGIAGGPGAAAAAGAVGVARGVTRAGAARKAIREFTLPKATAIPFTASAAAAGNIAQ